MPGVVLLGRTGVGKSSLINSVFGVDVAPVDPYRPCTQVVELFAHNDQWGELYLVDTPGLGEHDLDTDRHRARLIRDNVQWGRVNHVLFVSSLKETRFRPEERRAIEVLKETLGMHRFHRPWLALTFAASVPAATRHATKDHRVDALAEAIGMAFEKIIVLDNAVSGWADGLVPLSYCLQRS